MLAHVPTVTVAVDPNALTVAMALLCGSLGALVLAVVVADRRGLLSTADVPFRRWVAIVAGGLSLGAGSIHVAVIEAHLEEYPPFGVAFLALAGFQVVWAIAYLLSPQRPLALAAIAVNAGALLVWTVSRTIGLPFGPEPGHVDPAGPLDVAAGAMEIALIALLAWGLGAIGERVRPSLPRVRAVIVLGSSSLVVALLTSAAFVMAGGDPHGDVAHVAAPPVSGSASSTPAPTSPPATADAAGPSIADGPSSPPSSQATGPPPSSPAAPPVVASPSPVPSNSPETQPPRSSQPPARATPAPTRRPTSRPTTPPPTSPGDIRFGTSLGSDGEIAEPATRFGEGQHAVWIADFSEAPNVATIRMYIVQVLPDGREFEHWREDIPLAHPASGRLVGGADLSIYLHGGDGRHLMRYMRGDALLAEGAFELVR